MTKRKPHRWYVEYGREPAILTNGVRRIEVGNRDDAESLAVQLNLYALESEILEQILAERKANRDRQRKRRAKQG